MRVGIYTDLRNPPAHHRPWPDHYARALDLIVGAEALGAATVWLSEHHLYDDGYLPQPLTFAAAIAARTSRIRIGTAVFLAALRHPLQLAEEAALVDILSNGRLDLGVGVGYRREEFEAFGVAIEDRFETLERTIREVEGWWRSAKATPPPVQDPMPLWGGFFGPRGARLAGRLGMGLLPSVRRARQVIEPYGDGLEAAGRSRSEARLSSLVNFVVVDDPEKAWTRIVPGVVYQQQSYARHGAQYFEERLRNDHTPAGLDFYAFTPEEAERYVKDATVGLPVEEIYCWVSPGGMPDDLTERHVELLCSDLAERLADWHPTHM